MTGLIIICRKQNKTIIKFNFIVEFIDFKRFNANFSLTQLGKKWLDFQFTGIPGMFPEKYLNWQIINDTHHS